MPKCKMAIYKGDIKKKKYVLKCNSIRSNSLLLSIDMMAIL